MQKRLNNNILLAVVPGPIGKRAITYCLTLSLSLSLCRAGRREHWEQGWYLLIGLDGIIPLIVGILLLMNESMYSTNKISKKTRKIKFGLYPRYSSFTFMDQTKHSL